MWIWWAELLFGQVTSQKTNGEGGVFELCEGWKHYCEYSAHLFLGNKTFEMRNLGNRTDLTSLIPAKFMPYINTDIKEMRVMLRCAWIHFAASACFYRWFIFHRSINWHVRIFVIIEKHDLWYLFQFMITYRLIQYAASNLFYALPLLLLMFRSFLVPSACWFFQESGTEYCGNGTF